MSTQHLIVLMVSSPALAAHAVNLKAIANTFGDANLAAFSKAPKDLDQKFLYDVISVADSCFIKKGAVYRTFLNAISSKFGFEKGAEMVREFTGKQRLAVLMGWKVGVKNIKLLHLVEGLLDVKKELCKRLDEEIARELDWLIDVNNGGPKSTIPINLDADFAMKLMVHDKIGNLWFKDSFMDIVNKEHAGGGLHGSERGFWLKRWEEALQDVLIGLSSMHMEEEEMYGVVEEVLEWVKGEEKKEEMRR